MSKLVIVTGSGRSGTSSVAGTLKRLGLHIPQPEVEADERNPRGYYEPLWVAAFHKRFLNNIPVRTIDSRPDAGDIAMAEVTPELETELREWLAAELAAHPRDGVLAIKETRAYWVYPLWLRVAESLGAEVTSLMMLRHPTQVVRSRDSAYLTEESDAFRRQRETTNVAAWMNSVFETERATRGNPRAFVPYYDLIGDWRAAMTRACDQLGLDPGDLTAQHPVDDFLTTSLNRSGAEWDGLMVTPSLIEMAERTWAAAHVLVEKPQDSEAMAELGRLRANYVELYEASAAIALDETTAQVAAARKKLKARLATKQERIERLRAEVAALKSP
ncbi:MAG: hypothetical protein M3445_08010 [Actinomycetota bacterium]|nr:hypothetical protein [Actinomycetota bacterium]